MDKNRTNDKHLRLVRGAELPVEERIRRLGSLSPAQRMKAILDDPEPKRLIGRLQRLDLYRTAREVGLSDAQELLELAGGEQLVFCLDVELWEEGEFSDARSVEWLNFLVAAGDDTVEELLPHLDPELLMLILKRQIMVGGGIGELVAEEERLADWDHSFDNMFMIKFRNPKTSRVVGSFLDMVYRLDHPLYVVLMEGVKGELEGELEELAFRFRCGRLADEGFPLPEEALEVYSPIDPQAFVPAKAKELPGGEGRMALLPAAGEEGLSAALAEGGEGTEAELGALLNSVLVAEHADLADPEALRRVLERVYGYLAIGVEHVAGLTGTDWAGVVRTQSLRDLFRLALGLTRRLRRLAPPQGEAGERVAGGLAHPVPLYWEGLDSSFDRYREFRTLEDLRRVERFLLQR
ncbi:MAG TPA: DUF6178 family protein [Verrucomicrobiae bacterium]|nr:DUF6178 family protein [Verrucomicrobiae bacterium]